MWCLLACLPAWLTARGLKSINPSKRWRKRNFSLPLTENCWLWKEERIRQGRERERERGEGQRKRANNKLWGPSNSPSGSAIKTRQEIFFAKSQAQRLTNILRILVWRDDRAIVPTQRNPITVLEMEDKNDSIDIRQISHEWYETEEVENAIWSSVQPLFWPSPFSLLKTVFSTSRIQPEFSRMPGLIMTPWSHIQTYTTQTYTPTRFADDKWFPYLSK